MDNEENRAGNDFPPVNPENGNSAGNIGITENTADTVNNPAPVAESADNSAEINAEGENTQPASPASAVNPPVQGAAQRGNFTPVHQVVYPAPAPTPAPRKKKKDKSGAKRVFGFIAMLLVCAIVSAVVSRASVNSALRKAGLLTEKVSMDAEVIHDDDIYPTDSEDIAPEEPATESTTEEPTTEAPTTEPPTTVPPTTIPPTTAAPAITKSSIYANAVHSVVGICSVYTVTTTGLFGLQSTKNYTSTGTGFYVSSTGCIVTNRHVIENGQYLTVTDYEGNNYSATLLAYTDNSDVAILKINTATQSVTFGNSSELKVGDDCMIIGNPMGNLSYSFTDGMISFTGRDIATDNGLIINMFQTNAAINAGNSGGPVFNSKGEVIGIATAKYTTSEGLGFFIPIDDVKSFIYSNIS